MGQAVKYAVLGAALVAVIALVSAIIVPVINGQLFSGFSQSAGQFVASVSPTIQNVRGALNYVFGTNLMSLAIPFYFSIPISLVGFKTIIVVYRWLNQ